MRAQAANTERSGEPVSEDMHNTINNVQRMISDNLDFYLKKKQEQADIRVQFDADIKRLRELLAEKKAKNNQ